MSRNNGFLLATGIIEGGQKKAISESGRALALALEHGLESETHQAWGDIIAQTEFMERLLSAVRIRNGMEPASLQSHVACSAGQPNKGIVKTGSATVVEILKAAGAVVERDGKLVVSEFIARDGTAPGPPAARGEPAGVAESIRVEAMPATSTGSGVVNVEVRVNIDCAVGKIAGLRQSLRGLLRDLGISGTSDIDG